MKPIAILYEHPTWFQPLFDALDRRGIEYVKLHINDVTFDPACTESPYALVVNRVSAFPSATSDPTVVFYVRQYLHYLEAIGVRVINGARSFEVGISKAQQATILRQLLLRSPRSIAIHRPEQAYIAAQQLQFPVIIKPTIGGSGTGIVRFDRADEIAVACQHDLIDLGIDGVALVQEFLPARNREIIRVEMLDSEFLYGLRLPIAEGSFNYCPADGCNVTEGSVNVTAYTPPQQVIDDVRRILRASGADIGGVEYLVNDNDGEIYYYDINPLSNFVADAVNVVGFDPVARFVNYISAQFLVAGQADH